MWVVESKLCISEWCPSDTSHFTTVLVQWTRNTQHVTKLKAQVVTNREILWILKIELRRLKYIVTEMKFGIWIGTFLPLQSFLFWHWIDVKKENLSEFIGSQEFDLNQITFLSSLFWTKDDNICSGVFTSKLHHDSLYV